MNARTEPGDQGEFIERLARAVNDHDIDALTGCFAIDYRNETPVHPTRGFTGRNQVRKNWEQLFSLIPDLRAEVLRVATAGDVIFSEWEHSGTRLDGSLHLMRGVIIFGVSEGEAKWSRFYLDPVQEDAQGVDGFIRDQAGSKASS